MNKFVKKASSEVEAKVYAIMIPAAEEGIGCWRRGDKMTAKEIVGSAAYEEVTKLVSGQRHGQLFAAAVAEGMLPLAHAGQGSSPDLLYILKN